MDTRTQEFLEYVQSGGQVETGDWMPDEYRSKLVKFIEMHGNSELMGVLPERDWILRAPTLQRKLALTAKIQDEVGHAQLIYRVVEDLGKLRSACLDDLVSGKAKFQAIKTGLMGELSLEVVSGLAGGETLITGPFKALRALKPGDAVKVEEKKKDGAKPS